MNATIIAGARPNFMKVAPIIKAIQQTQAKKSDVHFRLVHTGQHYDSKMSGAFFEQLGIPEPHVNLAAGGGSQAEQTAAIMTRIEKELVTNRPDVLLVVGDVTSTMACAIAAKKLGIDVVHVEAGIRSGDMSMPEEINRIVTDSICDHFFTTSEIANQNLLQQGVTLDRIHFVGNTMIDTLIQNRNKLTRPHFWDSEELVANGYFLITLHRPSNVDDPMKLRAILEAIEHAIGESRAIFPVHPRTKMILNEIKFDSRKFLLVDPQGYYEFIYLVKHAQGIITDSGGVTEEATVLDIPCVTLRTTTERPETVTLGTNELVGDNYELMGEYIRNIGDGKWKRGSIPPMWDGQTGERIVSILTELYG